MKSGNRISGLSAYLTISSLVNLATWVLVLLPNFLQGRGWNATEVGLAMGAYFFVNLISQIVAGTLADRIGNIKTALIGTAVGTAAALFYILAFWWPFLIFPARLLHGAGTGLITSGALIELTSTVPLHLRGPVMGYFGLPGFLMIGIGPVVCEWLVYTWGFLATFVLILVLFIVTALLLARLPASYNKPSGVRKPFREVFRANFGRLENILAFSICFGFCFSSWNSFVAPAVKHLGEGAVSSFGFGYAVGAILTRLGFSHRINTPGRRLAGVSMLATFAVGLGAIPLAGAAWQLALIGWLGGIGHGIFYPSLSSIAAERFHPLYPGQGMTLYVSASGLGLFVGPPLWGALADQHGYGPVFVAAGLFMLAATIIFIASERRGVGGSSRAAH